MDKRDKDKIKYTERNLLFSFCDMIILESPQLHTMDVHIQKGLKLKD